MDRRSSGQGGRAARSGRALRRSGTVLGVAALAMVSALPARAAPPGIYRLIGATPHGLMRAGRLADGLGSAPPAPRSLRASIRVATVDANGYTGYENAVYAADDNTVYVAYKRFLSDPSGGGYIPAELRVAKSADGGRTWTITVLDPNAIEQGDTVDGSVSIDGDHGSTVYVAYHVRSSGLFADMKLMVARSTDGGASWGLQTVADSYAGDYNSFRVIDASSAMISAHAAGTEEGIHVYTTTNGGGSWTDTFVAGGLGNGYYTSIGATNARTAFVSYYNSLYPDHTDANAGRRTGPGSWKTMVVDGTPGDGENIGLGSAITVALGPTVYMAYEADTFQGAFVRVAKFVAGVPGWTIEPVQQGPTIGWNTAVHAVGTANVYLSYWYVPAGKGQAVLATSTDGGTTWAVVAIPEQRWVQPYLDSTAPSTAVQFESYQTTDQAGQQPALRVARISA